MKIQLIKLEDTNILVSDEKIDEGHYVYHKKYGMFRFETLEQGNISHQCKKIIAGIPDLPQIDYSSLSLEDKEKLNLFREDRIIASAQSYALDKCRDNISCLTKIKRAFEDGMELCDKESEKQFTFQDMVKIVQSMNGAPSDISDESAKSIVEKFVNEKRTLNIKVEMENLYDDDNNLLLVELPAIRNNSIKLLKIL